ncbi:hypothetical protein ISS30_03750 [bacterium]|nr:hypothetical protein [bacterium]
MFRLSREETYALILTAIIYAFLIVFTPNGFWVIDEGNKYIWARNLMKGNGFIMEDEAAVISPGHQASHPRFTITRDPGETTVFSPFYIILISLFIGMGGLKAALIFTALISILLIITARRLAEAMGYKTGFLFIFILGTASPILFYSLVMWEHGIAGLLLLIGILTAYRSRPEQFTNMSAGMLMALAVYIRPESIIFSICAWYFLFGRRWRILQGLFLGIILCAVLNLLFTGSLIPLQLAANLSGWERGSPFNFMNRLDSLYSILLEANNNLYLSAGAIICAAAFFLLPGVFKFVFPAYLLILIILTWFSSAPFIYLGDLGSLLYTAPLFFAAISAKSADENQKRVKLFIIAVSVLTALASPVSGGIHFGPRLLFPLFPFFAMLAVNEIHRTKKAGEVFLFNTLIGLVIVQLLVSIWSVDLLYKRRQANAVRRETIMSQSNSSVLTVQWWLRQEIPELWFSYKFFMVESELELKRMLIDFHEKGIRFFTVLIGSDEASQQLAGIMEAAPPKQIGVFTVETGYPTMDLTGLRYAIGFDDKGAADLADELGVYFGQIGKLDESEKYLRKAVDWVNSNPDHHYNLGYCLGKKRLYQQALCEIEKAVELAPANQHYSGFAEELRRRLEKSR